MVYFTEQGVKKIIEKYHNLIGKEFHFSNSSEKHKLNEIKECIAGCGFDIYFSSYTESLLRIPIHEFMSINKITGYNFNDYDLCSEQIQSEL